MRDVRQLHLPADMALRQAHERPIEPKAVRDQSSPQLKRVRVLSVRTKTPEVGVVVRVGANSRTGSAY